MKIIKKVSVATETKNKSSNRFIITSMALQLFVFMLFFIINKKLSYSIDNYRYILSSLLQIIGSIFAFIASSTLVAYQFLTSFSPISTQYYPKKLFVSFLIITLTIIGFDVLAINVLQSEINVVVRCIYDFLITLNVYPLSFAFIYILFVIKSITPQNQLLKILENAKKANTNDDRVNVMYSLEEMCLSAIQHGQGGYVHSCQDTFSEIIKIYTTSRIELNSNSSHHPDNPLRTLPDIIERISYSMIDNNMQNLLHFNGHILRELSSARYDGKRIVGVEIAIAIKNIGVYCIEKRKITDIKNFIANAIFCLDKNNSADTMFWGCKLLMNSCQNYIEFYTHETLEVIEEIYTCVDYSIENKNVRAKDGILIIDFLCNQEWLKPYFEKNSSTKIPTLIEKFINIRVDLDKLSKK
ncbi:MAG: hypothetical protein IJW11_02480 [Clostridia bacterium]|nr:hypothetical protein [Clostridia bacterium]